MEHTNEQQRILKRQIKSFIRENDTQDVVLKTMRYNHLANLSVPEAFGWGLLFHGGGFFYAGGGFFYGKYWIWGIVSAIIGYASVLCAAVFAIRTGASYMFGDGVEYHLSLAKGLAVFSVVFGVIMATVAAAMVRGLKNEADKARFYLGTVSLQGEHVANKIDSQIDLSTLNTKQTYRP